MKTKLVYFDENFECDGILACIGGFDGVHLGHSSLVETAVSEAKKNGYKSAMISFFPHPDYVLGRREDEGYLTVEEEKLDILSSKGVDYLIVMDFSKVCAIHHEEFYNKYLSKFAGIVAGFDFKFGYRGSGNTEFLKEKFELCKIIDKVEVYGKKVGSSDIREKLVKGNLKVANELLGRPYSLYVKVEEIINGMAHCSIDNRCFKPKDNKYKCEYIINEWESCSNTCIIEKTALRMNDNNVSKGDVIKVSLLECIESGV